MDADGEYWRQQAIALNDSLSDAYLEIGTWIAMADDLAADLKEAEDDWVGGSHPSLDKYKTLKEDNL